MDGLYTFLEIHDPNRGTRLESSSVDQVPEHLRVPQNMRSAGMEHRQREHRHLQVWQHLWHQEMHPSR